VKGTRKGPREHDKSSKDFPPWEFWQREEFWFLLFSLLAPSTFPYTTLWWDLSVTGHLTLSAYHLHSHFRKKPGLHPCNCQSSFLRESLCLLGYLSPNEVCVVHKYRQRGGSWEQQASGNKM
jgi:hypothetical protein